MDSFENTNTFYPTTLADYDVNVTLHPADSLFTSTASLDPIHPSNHNNNNNIDNLNIDLDSFAGDLPSLLARKHQLNNAHHIFEEAYSDVNSNYDQQYFPEQPAHEAKTPPLDSQDPLLQFSPPTYNYPLLDYTYDPAPVSIDAQLNGMFFSSYSEVAASTIGEDAPLTQQSSLTCYRRNLFSIVGSITLPRSPRYISTEHGEQIPIINAEVTLSATESMEGAAVKLISVPFKSASMPAGAEEKADKDPAPVPIDLMSGSDSMATFPIVWKRLQFRSSTANNGRRKELQQMYSCRVSFVATLSTGQRVSLCDLITEPIVVRGRSPRAFAAKKEAPTSGSIISQARNKPGMPRFATTDGLGPMPNVKSELEYNFDFNGLGMISPDTWQHQRNTMSHHGGAMTALPPDTFRINPNDFLAQSSPDISRYTPAVNVPAPVNLSLMDDEVAKKPSPGQARDTRKTPRLQNAGGRPPSFSLTNLQTNNDNDDADDPLYEYFPLSLDDWQEPVDAVYRPHVVHHISLPAAAKDMSRTRSKRYFSVASPT